MKYKIFLMIFIIMFISNLFSSELIKIKSFDKEIILGKLDIPENKTINTLVIFVHGTGPNTYENYRKIGKIEFNYYDFFSKEFNKINVAFFRYNTRGTDIGKEPPYFDKVNKERFKKYLPNIQVKDIENIIKYFKKDKRFKKSKIILLGWSEGTIISPIVAERKKVKIDALLLAGYANDNLKDIITWQLFGGSSMVFYKKNFDLDNNNIISKEEYEADPNNVIKIYLQNTKFNSVDLNKNNLIDENDFQIMLSNRKAQVFKAINNNNDEWLWSNYFRVTSKWAKEHFKLAPNKKRLLKLNIPIYIFHGTEDQNVPVQGAIDIQNLFTKNKKDNLEVFIFKNHDHDLNYISYPLKGEISEGLLKILEIVKLLNTATADNRA